uniref:Uncharacterized protein n=1 Tax=Fagus sylvatica TaxID=28930 RepID=A0A2N9HDI7_FAGSY
MPLIPSGKPGKFSTSEVVVSCPPGATPFRHPTLKEDWLQLRTGHIYGSGVGSWATSNDAHLRFEGLEVIHGRSRRTGGSRGGCSSRSRSGSGNSKRWRPIEQISTLF